MLLAPSGVFSGKKAPGPLRLDLDLLGQVRPQQRLEQLAVVGHLEMQKLVDDDLTAEGGWLRQRPEARIEAAIIGVKALAALDTKGCQRFMESYMSSSRPKDVCDAANGTDEGRLRKLITDQLAKEMEAPTKRGVINVGSVAGMTSTLLSVGYVIWCLRGGSLVATLLTTLPLWRWLDRAVKEGLVLVEGTGRRNHPFRYWLDGMEEVWKSDPRQRFLDSRSRLRRNLGHPGPLRKRA